MHATTTAALRTAHAHPESGLTRPVRQREQPPAALVEALSLAFLMYDKPYPCRDRGCLAQAPAAAIAAAVGQPDGHAGDLPVALPGAAP